MKTTPNGHSETHVLYPWHSAGSSAPLDRRGGSVHTPPVDLHTGLDQSAVAPAAHRPAGGQSPSSAPGQAILFADIRGFTSYTRDRGDEQAYRLAKEFMSLAQSCVERHGGRVVKTLGDGIMATFPQALASVRCASEVQEGIARRNAARPGDAFTSGIGIAWGTPIEEDGDLFGFVVNLAQRLADRARGGQILVSPSVVERTAGNGIPYLHLGNQDLNGLGPQEIHELLWRDEVARITTKDGRLNLILTQDALVMELDKAVQEKVQLVRKLLTERAGRRRGIRGFLLNKTMGLLERRVPQMVDRALFQAGFGLEHPLADVTASFDRNILTVRIRRHRGIRLGPKDVDPWLATEFVAKLNQLRAGLSRGS